jgi:putative heme-binding domain-containing protein
MLIRSILSVLCLFGLVLEMSSAEETKGEFKPLFNGKDLTGWDGNPALWSVREGMIVGQTTDPKQLKYNEFLIWRGGMVKNFELKAKIKITGNNNTGIQYRSKERPDLGKWVVSGYQCDIHPNAPYTAMMYEEKGRGIIGQNGQSVVVDPETKRWLVTEREPVKVAVAEWHEYSVKAVGNKMSHYIDGKLTTELLDFNEQARALEGLVAFQIHAGPVMEVQIKEVMLKALPDGAVVPFEKSAIPSDAQIIEDKKPAAPKPKPAKKATGAAIGENKATPVERIKAPKDFKVELLYSVPGGDQGSWVALCHDPKGRIYASDQYGGLYRFPAPAPGEVIKPESVEKVPVEMRAVNGMLFAFGALYVGVNDYEQKMKSGLYRISDSNNDDQLDKVELLRGFDSKGDHGVHAVVLTPDGKGLYLITGNNAILTETVAHSPVPKLWGDDHLLPRMPDGRGHNRHVMAPGGIIYRVSPDGKEFEIFSSGFRNIYDAGVNTDGELFTYDADMEYDFNTSWYRPTRINHVVAGSEWGWRNGAGKYPEFYMDNLPASLNIGPGSPTGTVFGYGAKFPAKYQRAFYVLDWSWGKIYAVHLKPQGASYTATKEEFITGGPLPVTDAIIHPDGAMYFAIGGRRVQSGLYRVSYLGSEATTPIADKAHTSPEFTVRRDLESLLGKANPKAVNVAWPHLSHQDRFIRATARTVLEHQPRATWEAKVWTEKNPTAQLEALLALVRVGGVCPTHRKPEHVIDTALRDQAWKTLLALDYAKLPRQQQLDQIRLAQIILNRFGNPDEATVTNIIAKFDAVFPAPTFEENWLLCELLAYLQAPNAAAKGMALIEAAESQEPQIEYARSLRMLKAGWTKELRTKQLEWFLKAANFKGGSSFSIFIDFIRKDSLATFTDEEKTSLAALIEKKPEVKSALEVSNEFFVGRTPTNWTLEQLSAAAEKGMKGRNYENGRKMFSASACYACHRFGNAGGMTGPDLTGAGGRYSAHDLLDQIINPSKEINEQFAPIIVTRNNGEVLSGVVVNLSGDGITINTDLSDPNQRVNVDRKEVKSIEPSKVSLMPPMLLAMLNEQEILDLVAYILSGGDKTNAMFKP